MKRSMIIGAALIISATILSYDKIHSISQFNNSLSTTAGHVRLGEVYSERETTKVTVTFDETGNEAMNFTVKTSELYSKAESELDKIIEEVNKQFEKEKKTLLTKDTVTWTENATIKLVTTVHYESEFQPNYNLIIDETEFKHTVPPAKDSAEAKDEQRVIPDTEKNIMDHFERLKTYSTSQVQAYETKFSFIK